MDHSKAMNGTDEDPRRASWSAAPEVTSAFVLMGLALARRAMMQGRVRLRFRAAPRLAVIPRESGVPSTPQRCDLSPAPWKELDHPLSRVTTAVGVRLAVKLKAGGLPRAGARIKSAPLSGDLRSDSPLNMAPACA